MFLNKLFNKKEENKTVAIKENNYKTIIVGEDTPFLYLNDATKEYKKCNFLRILRKENGKCYWESVKPYEIIDGNLCVRSKADIPHVTGWIVLTKNEVEDILAKM